MFNTDGVAVFSVDSPVARRYQLDMPLKLRIEYARVVHHVIKGKEQLVLPQGALSPSALGRSHEPQDRLQ